ncbi:hypothetical protein [Brevibacterium luteolum]|uniref:hypothetical protein n=1 Tax=Brevibacterium luteolum TaxID=199591 RepID=UPI001C21160A|nr:hypothetical protein [Brevibacterium luteolum]MBU8579134.1 hypothetical protein [Brevibacterium luteolum]
MKRQWITPLALAAVLLIVIATFVTPTGSTLARWYKGLTTDELSATTDRYTLDFADVPSDSESADPASPPVWNLPGFEVTNNSETLARPMQITRAELTSRYTYTSAALDPVRNSRITYSLAAAGSTCESETRDLIWTVKQVGEAPQSTYTPPAGDGNFTLAPGETRHVCVDVQLNEASSTPEERLTLLRRFAGAGVKAVTDVEPAEQLSTDGTESDQLTSLYRVAFPQPVPNPALRFSGTGTAGCELADVRLSRGYIKLQWAWPESESASEASTPAVARWELWKRVEPGGGWQKVTNGEHLRSGDWRGAPRDNGGNIPPERREVFLERGEIRGPGFDGSDVHNDFVVVGVLNNAFSTRFVAAESWDISWNGHTVSSRNRYICHFTDDTPDNVTGGPNMPAKEW